MEKHHCDEISVSFELGNKNNMYPSMSRIYLCGLFGCLSYILDFRHSPTPADGQQKVEQVGKDVSRTPKSPKRSFGSSLIGLKESRCQTSHV